MENVSDQVVGNASMEVSVSGVREFREEEGTVDTTSSSSTMAEGEKVPGTVLDAAEVGHMEETGAPSSHVRLLTGKGVTELVESEQTEVGTSDLNERAHQENALSVPVEVTKDADLNDSGEHVVVSSSTQESLGEYGCHIDYVKEAGGADEGGTVGEGVVVDNIPVGNLLGDPVSPREEMVKEDDSLFPLVTSNDRLESLRSLLYLANIEKDVLEWQLAEHVKLNAESYQHSSDEVSKLLGLVKEAHESKDSVSEELIHCRSELQAAALENKKLENRCSLTKEEIDQFHSRASELQTKLEHSQEEHSRVSDKLANCHFSMEVLQKENLDLVGRLASEIDAAKKLAEENTRLAAELLEQKELLLTALNKQMQLEGDLIETGVRFEEFAMENLYLSSNVVVYEAKIKELDGYHFKLPIQAREEVPRSNASNMEGVTTDNANDDSHITSNGDVIDVVPDTAGNSIAIQKEEGVVPGSSDALGLLKGHLEELEDKQQHMEYQN